MYAPLIVLVIVMLVVGADIVRANVVDITPSGA